MGTFELSDPEFWTAPRDYRHGAFRSLRAAAELRFFDEWEYVDSPLPKGPGYWAITRYDDVWSASRNPRIVSIRSIPGGTRARVETVGPLAGFVGAPGAGSGGASNAVTSKVPP